MNIKTVFTHAAFLLLASPLQAQVFETFSFSPALAIPDGNATGISDEQSIASAGTSITSLKVTLDLTGNFNGDLYLYLRHDSGFSVLLNRPGRAADNLFGYDDSGFSVSFSDDAAHDIHEYRTVTAPAAGVPLSGEWQPDGREASPFTTVTTSPRTADLGSFHGVNPNGLWTLFAADMVNGGTSQIQNWSVQITAVPEPAEFVLVAGGALLGFGLWRRSKKS